MHEKIKKMLADNAALHIGEDIRRLHDENREEGVPTILTDGLNELLLLAKIRQPKKILELGTAAGCSGIALLKALPSAVLYTVEAREKSYLAAKENFISYGVADRVKQFLGDARDVLCDINEKFDFVFLDCNKSKYKELYGKIKEFMSDGAVLFADNVLFRGYITEEVKVPHRFKTIQHNMTDFLVSITTDPDMITTISDVGDGISISYKKEKETSV